MDIIKVKANSRTAAVAGAIAGVMREHKHAEVQAIGAGAVNQAVKALVLAKGYLAEDGMTVSFTAEFVDVNIEDKVRTAIKITVDVKAGTTFPVDMPKHVSEHVSVNPVPTPEMTETPPIQEVPEITETPAMQELPETPETPPTV
jgi:stage V sporulation protein S